MLKRKAGSNRTGIHHSFQIIIINSKNYRNVELERKSDLSNAERSFLLEVLTQERERESESAVVSSRHPILPRTPYTHSRATGWYPSQRPVMFVSLLHPKKKKEKKERQTIP